MDTKSTIFGAMLSSFAKKDVEYAFPVMRLIKLRTYWSGSFTRDYKGILMPGFCSSNIDA
jgi:hypothetical protein